MNRYTRLTPAKFNPMSLEEQMMVPLAKQKKHDMMLEQQDLIARDLYDVQRLEPDNEAATNMITDYQNRLDQISNQLSSEGVTRDGMNNFRNLYRDYRFDTSNSGTLGKIQNNYNEAKTRELETRKIMAQQGWSQDKINQAIQQGYDAFSGTLSEDGAFNQFEGFNAPNFYDHRKEIQSLLSQAKYDQISVGGQGSNIEYDPMTGFYRVTETTPGAKRYNAQQIASGLNSMTTAYSQGDKADYLALSGISPEMFQQEIEQIAGTFRFNQEIPGKTSTSYRNPPSGSSSRPNTFPSNTWESNPYILRQGKDGADPLADKLMQNTNMKFTQNTYDLRGRDYGSYSDYYGRGLNNASGTVSGDTLEQMMLDPNYKIEQGGTATIKNGDEELFLSFGQGTNQVVVSGTYNGQTYSTAIKDPQIVNLFGEYAGTEEGRNEYKEGVLKRESTMNEFRKVDPFLSSMSDRDLAQAYTDVIAQNSDYFTNTISPNNPDSSYWFATTNKILGDPKTGNFGNITTKKVRLFTEDGNELASFQNNKKVADMVGIDALSNMIMDNEYDDLNEDEKKLFHTKLQQAQNLGITTGDHEFANEVNFSVTDKNGDTFYFKVENNNEMSGKNGQYPGIDDASQMNRYLVEGNSFVSEGKETFYDSNGQPVDAYKYFVHIPYMGPNGFEIRPAAIYSRNQYNSLSELTEDIDIENMAPKPGVAMKLENIAQVNARVAYNIEQYYDSTPQGKTTKKEVN